MDNNADHRQEDEAPAAMTDFADDELKDELFCIRFTSLENLSPRRSDIGAYDRQGVLAGTFSDSLIRNRAKTYGEIKRQVVAHMAAEEAVTMKHGNTGTGQAKPRENNRTQPDPAADLNVEDVPRHSFV
ncbi:hypothetical protein VNO80_13234 [Phaseolus coccineus]|uniref:Uncharacterized protein n=1 Tax=Phaseolus coccineus TaxID=3886 RepID=A0AAN9N1A4_PHACN